MRRLSPKEDADTGSWRISSKAPAKEEGGWGGRPRGRERDEVGGHVEGSGRQRSLRGKTGGAERHGAGEREQGEPGACQSLRLIRAPGGLPTPRSAFRDRRPVAGPQRPSTPGDGSHQQHIYTPFTQRLKRPSAGVYAFPGRLSWSISGASLTAKRAQGASAISPCLRRQLGGHCAWRSGDWGGCRGSV